MEYRNGVWVLERGAQPDGWNWSRPGEVWYTKVPYAALEYYEQGSEAAQEVLRPYHEEYQRSWAQETGFRAPIPKGLELMPFQQAGVEYALSRPHALIGDQPGLGKTAQAIAISNVLDSQATLVICPAAVRYHWRGEIMRWSAITGVRPYCVFKATDGVHPRAPYVVLSYDLVSRSKPVLEAVLRRQWKHLILDEAHYLKTISSRRTKAVFGSLAQKCERVTALTGTPLPNRPRECYTLTRSLCWEAIDWMSYEKFKFRFNPSDMWREEVGRLPELHARLRCNYLVRRLKSAVLSQLPEKTYELVEVEENGGISKVLRAEKELVGDMGVVEEWLANLKADPKAMGHIATLRREMGVAKVPRVVEHVTLLLEGGLDKLVLFTYHKEVIQLIVQELKAYCPVVIQGSTSMKQRHHGVGLFVSDPKRRVLVGQLQAAGTGIDGMQDAASVAVFAEPSWVAADNEQAVDRLHRHGQKSGVLAQFLVAPGSLDEKILGAAIRKEVNVKTVLDGYSQKGGRRGKSISN